MNTELYLTIVGSFVTVDILRNLVRFIERKRVKSKMDLLFKEIEATIEDIKTESTIDDKPRVRRNILKPIKN